MILAFLVLFENRSSLIVNNIFRITNNSTRSFWIFFNITGCMLPFIPVYFNLPDSGEARVIMLKSLPCPPKYFFAENILVLPSDGFWYTYLSASFLVSSGILFLQILFFTVCCLYYLFYAKSPQVSPETRRLQIRSFFGIVLQTTIPFLLVLIPVMLLTINSNPEIFDQSKNNFTFLPMVIHKGIDPDKAKITGLKALPCPPKYFFTENILVFPTDGFWYTYLSVTSLF
ncbi:Protein CBG17775 [Caenorhabditis briggsae]|uniref:Protein CBG17775 n=1 Tax=Caenorhabditis briggsae TaxID=6238 RepID=A8XRS2_CAEBR|nr:Protein CBG17775 [Caenorhabditis briggsae]CAP35347.1 Protein CBG17775 [Caenorhabditis briggsae]